ncbi:MAG: hypothetical protein A3F83_07525 [Candidatus Glassbacteria bacterium RIFCSPLOWO2_12_FULL_58_11]|uniref:DUF4097 domain-containing protein n=1 Tax=Candidatus Glassbacteria bacterium RIFCSPLOWO2_12_FULL_58_11 TaxID=1817867 RepID=A0A1F5Z2U2_9BACT|nr:MAG: hypothetical protein A3F83_07525 [Candidatus Glassbacteria bacterium RIFCSPLOWO2_12_FULL_58_11]
MSIFSPYSTCEVLMLAKLFKPVSTFLVVLTVCLAPALSADTLNRRFAIGSGGAVTVICSGGSVSLEGSMREDIQVTAVCDKEINKYYDLDFQTLGDSLVIIAEAKNVASNFLNLFKIRGNRPGLKFTLSVPNATNSHLNTSGGRITASALTGCVEARTSGGGLNIDQVTGDVNGYTSGGSIDCNNVTGQVTLKTSGGGIRLYEVNGPFDARTSGGTIMAGGLNGEGSLSTSGGGIRVKSGNGRLTVKTSGGSITVNGMQGSLNAYTSGGSIEAELTSQPSGDCELKTSGGGIRFSLPRASNARIDANTSGGSVSTDLPVTVEGEVGRNSLEGRLGQGGPLLTLKTSGGNIRISAGD